MRIEDTDRSRSTVESEQNIIEGLKWLGISWDEGPDVGGPFGPYRQMERLDIYQRYINRLLEEAKAYPCFCTEEELQKDREEQMKRGVAPKYSGKCKMLDPQQARMFVRDGRSHVVRFATPSKKVAFHDLIRGDVEFDASLFGDFVLIKSDGIPLFMLSNVVDDIEMKMTHVIRGEDHLSNTPKQILLYEAFGAAVPVFAHLPIILGPDKSKLSKRHGATSIDDYRKAGFLPEAICNFIAFLGWNPGTEQEIFTRDELIQSFSLERVQKSGAVFNIEKLEWINGAYIRSLSPEALVEKCMPYLLEAGLIKEGDEKNMLAKIRGIILLEQARLKTLSRVADDISFYFQQPVIDPLTLVPKKGNKERTLEALQASSQFIQTIVEADFAAVKSKDLWYQFAEQKSFKPIEILWPLRVALTGRPTSPGVFEIMEILGKKECQQRVDAALQAISK